MMATILVSTLSYLTRTLVLLDVTEKVMFASHAALGSITVATSMHLMHIKKRYLEVFSKYSTGQKL